MMPGLDGIATLDELKRIDEDLAVIIITAYASVERDFLMKTGAFDYIASRSRTKRCWSSCATRWSAGGWCMRTGISGRTSRSAITSLRTSSAAVPACGRCST
jgi:DNA-binding NarL/FixJ family response regulator